MQLDRPFALALILEGMDLAARNIVALERVLLGMESEHVANEGLGDPGAVRWA